MGTPASTPKTPTLLTVMVPSRKSAAELRLARAVAVRSSRAVVSPRQGEIVRVLDVRHHQPAGARHGDAQVDVPLRDHLVGHVVPRRVERGVFGQGEDAARATMANGVTCRPSKRRLFRSRSTSSTVGVASTVRKTQAWGAVATLRTMASAMCFWTPRTGVLVSRSDLSGTSEAATARSAARSSRVMIPPGPWPDTSARSTPFWRAMKRTGGAARGRAVLPGGGSGAGGVARSRCPLPLRRRRLGGASDGP